MPPQNKSRKLHGEAADFFGQLFFFFDAKLDDDVDILCQVCGMLLQYVKCDGGLVSLFATVDYSEVGPSVIIRVRKFLHMCIDALYVKRFQLVNQPEASSESDLMPFVQLLRTAICLLSHKLPWNCEVIGYLHQKKVFCLFREIIMVVVQNERQLKHRDFLSALYEVLALVASHVGNHPCSCVLLDPKWSFSSQILTIPFLCHRLPEFMKVLSADEFKTEYMYQIACADVLPNDTLANHPGQAYVLSNVLDIATLIFSESGFDSDRAAGIINFCTSLLDAFPKIASSIQSTHVDGAMPIEADDFNHLDVDLQRHILTSVECLVNGVLSGISSTGSSDTAGPSSAKLQLVGPISAFLHGMLSTGFVEGIMTVLVYNTEIVPALWNYIKSCCKNDKRKSFPERDTPSWLLPLSIFCSMYSHILELVDIAEFRDCKKPLSLSLEELKSLVSILKEALWELLWTIPVQTSTLQTSPTPGSKTLLTESLKHSARTGLCELFTKLEDWNIRNSFVDASEFCSKEDFSDEFVLQASIAGTRESEIIRLAPLLVPFDIRLKIFSQYLVFDQAHMADFRQVPAPRTLEIRRNQLLEDAIHNISLLSVEDLKGTIQVVFFDEHGMREAGVDGGGIFRDFMNTTTKTAFDARAGLFMETDDHLLYPNPESISTAGEHHLQKFHSLGVLLGKAIYERVPVDLSFAIFFLRKLKEKPTFFNDLFSLDPVYYDNLCGMKKNPGLWLDFPNLLPGVGEIDVNNDNVITYMHLRANEKLNFQACIQTAQFLRGLQQLIPKKWIDMFNEHEFQLLISGPPCLNLEDLLLNTKYGGEYHEDHEVIVMFWNVLRRFSQNEQKQFLFYVIPGTDDTGRLPRAHTCFNELMLPPYQIKEQMRDRLSVAISANAGFDLM
ncbi:hypothetical protein VPH35_130948 [Triticum aestivum]|uniref:HECT-type E3 ubiquitin transferase n=2 Tax=Triticum TaxID=4564 RepID=A0A9R1A8H6_TRITD|nr:E3 ubiquitin-protein ligase UPL6-like isoform X2 [Triticum aestivum]VAI91109.1 unnamed protein product [Triticum turgidum subsp. durum]